MSSSSSCPTSRAWKTSSAAGCRIVNTAARPITIGDREINITVSVGLCIYPDCGLEADQLLKNADAAMYVVKDTGRNGLQIFTESMIEESTGKLGFKLEDGPYR
jgi:GGDEF domain-containing protein